MADNMPPAPASPHRTLRWRLAVRPPTPLTCCVNWTGLAGKGGGGVPALWREINSSLRVERQRSKLDVVYRGVPFAAGQTTCFFFNTITSAFRSHLFLYITRVSNCVIWRCKQDSGLAITNKPANRLTLLLMSSDGVCRNFMLHVVPSAMQKWIPPGVYKQWSPGNWFCQI
jgi:hypothetical protein